VKVRLQELWKIEQSGSSGSAEDFYVHDVSCFILGLYSGHCGWYFDGSPQSLKAYARIVMPR
jgi:hypothetical protein